MKKKLINKLKSQGGETLAEVLIALLISALALTMLAGIISASGKIVLGSMDKMKTYLSAENQIVSYDAEDPVSSAEGTLTLYIKKNGSDTKCKLTEQNAGTDVDIVFYKSDVLGKIPVVSYKVK